MSVNSACEDHAIELAHVSDQSILSYRLRDSFDVTCNICRANELAVDLFLVTSVGKLHVGVVVTFLIFKLSDRASSLLASSIIGTRVREREADATNTHQFYQYAMSQ